jgi:hypothetical protein
VGVPARVHVRVPERSKGARGAQGAQSRLREEGILTYVSMGGRLA